MRASLVLLLLAPLLAAACAGAPRALPVSSGEAVAHAAAPAPPPPPSLELLGREREAPVVVHAAPRRVETALRLPAPRTRRVSRPAAPARDVRALFARTTKKAPPSACDT